MPNLPGNTKSNNDHNSVRLFWMGAPNIVSTLYQYISGHIHLSYSLIRAPVSIILCGVANCLQRIVMFALGFLSL